MAGPGRAAPAGTLSFTYRTNDIVSFDGWLMLVCTSPGVTSHFTDTQTKKSEPETLADKWVHLEDGVSQQLVGKGPRYGLFVLKL